MFSFRVIISWPRTWCKIILKWLASGSTFYVRTQLPYCKVVNGEGNGTPLQYSCLENPMDGGAWWAAVHGVAKSRTRLSDFNFTFHFHALEKATHSSALAWKIPGMGEPGGLLSMGLHRVGHDWSDLAAAAAARWLNEFSDLLETGECLEKRTRIHHLKIHTCSLFSQTGEYNNDRMWMFPLYEFSSVQFSHSVMSESLRSHEPQHARPPCPSSTPGVYPNSCPLCWWCHPTISSSVVPFSSCPQSFPASRSF